MLNNDALLTYECLILHYKQKQQQKITGWVGIKVVNKYASILRVTSKNCQDFFVVVLDIFLVVKYCSGKKNRHCTGHNLDKYKLKS